VTGHDDPSASWIDSHCHVHDPRFTEGAAWAIADARAAGVRAMVDIGTDRATSEEAIALAAAHDGVHATVGLHPHDASHGVETIVDLLDAPGVVAVGEAGLDYYYEHSPRDVQRRAFAEQIQLARQRSLPLVIHTRDAWDETFDVLDAEGVPERTIFHCFTGGPDEARRCLDRGAHLSFSGIVTFKNAEDVRAAAVLCPLDRMLVETDSPYLAPEPHRGSPNRPAWVAHVGAHLAALREVPVATIAEATSRRAAQLFGI
jgi:TatD DNase family protein